MNVISKVTESVKEFIKVIRFGKSDIITAYQFLPFGIDSKPRKDAKALILDTAETGVKASVGYFIQSDKSKPGELYIYATDNSDNIAFYIYLKNDGTCEFNGSADNLIAYNFLEISLNTYNNLLNLELGKIAAAITAVGGTYVVTPLTIDISTSKINNIKV